MTRALTLAAVALLCGLGLLLPATALAGTKGFHVGTKGFAVTKQSPKGAATQPAIAPAPTSRSKSKANSSSTSSAKEWFVTASGQKTTILAVSKSGAISKVSSSSTAASSGASTAPAYGSAIADGYDWLVRYGQSESPLYAISSSGQIKEVSADVGEQITDLTTGPDGTLNFSSQATGPISCTITSAPSASCNNFSLFGLLNSLLGGFAHLDSIAADSGKLWFTDNTGQLGNFNLVSALGGIVGGLLDDLLGGPFGDAPNGAGEGSASPNTIAADNNGYLYLAGGSFTSATGKNTKILKVDPATGNAVKTYTRGLTDVTALTAGYGNNIWFLDKKSSTSGRVGLLDTATGKITEYKLPAGFKFGPQIAQIAVGPAGSRTLYFTLETNSGGAAIGQLTVN